jgi:hypothetical protein
MNPTAVRVLQSGRFRPQAILPPRGNHHIETIRRKHVGKRGPDS